MRSLIEEAWEAEVVGSPMFKLFQKLKHCHHELVKWQRSKAVNSKMQISALKEMLANLKTDERHNNGEEILKREKELAKAYMQEERFWKEKSRVNWLKWGD